MKTLLLILLATAALVARADEFKLKPAQVALLVTVWPALDGYEKDVDQGPGNPRKVIRVNYSFTAEVRKKLAADHRAIEDAWTSYRDKAAALQKEVAEAVSGVGAVFDEKNKRHVAEINARAGDTFDTLTINLTPISQDDLLNADNPIPDSVLTAFTVLRAPAK